MLTLLLAALASAGPLDGWENSRWLIEIEETAPLQVAIAGPDANPPVIRGIQARAIVSCPDFKMAGKKAAYIGCSIDDLALRLTPQAPPGDRKAEYEKALEGLRQELINGKIELKLKEDGRLPLVDFQPADEPDQIVVETTRAIATDLFTGFSLFREDVPKGSAWTEKSSPLIRAATRPLGQGLTKIKHVPQVVEGMTLIDSTGDGTYQANYISWLSGRQEQLANSAAGSGYGSGAGATLAQVRNFNAFFNSRTIEGDTGPFIERVWNLTSQPKQDMNDMSGVKGHPLWSAGHIKRLAEGETPELGESGLVGARWGKLGDLPDWEPMFGG